MGKVLIVGNGFDLYHRLPTRYTDFLFFVNHWDEFIKKYHENPVCSSDIKWIEIRRTDQGELTEESIEDFAKYRGFYDEESIYELDECVQNAWVEYFNEIAKYMPAERNWVDFEAEIYKALQFLEAYFNNLSGMAGDSQVAPENMSSIVKRAIRVFGKKISSDEKYNLPKIRKNNINLDSLATYKEIVVSFMKSELDKLNLSLNLYMLLFVCSIKCDVYSRQINELLGLNLLNFNYTYTYKAVYGGRNLIQHHQIHGDAKERNIVLGIPDDTFEDTLDYIYFQKYFQRIQKKTGNYYKEWITKSETPALEDTPVEVFIMGHSLNIADKGILKDFFVEDLLRR